MNARSDPGRRPSRPSTPAASPRGIPTARVSARAAPARPAVAGSRCSSTRQPLHDPALPLAEVIDRYVGAWFATYGHDSKAQNVFELRVILAALEDDRLLRKLTGILDEEIERLAAVLVNRVIDPARPAERTTVEQSLAIAKAIKAVLTGFGLRQMSMPDAFELARRSCLALTALASDQ